MNKSIGRIIILVFVGLIISVFFILFGLKKSNEEKIKFYRKVKNENTFFNFIKPSPNSLLENEDVIIFKDVRIFDKKFSEKNNHCSRIIGKPGDLILIDNSKVFVNNKPLTEDYDLFFKYRITMSNPVIIEEFLAPFNIQITNVISENIACEFISTQAIVDEIIKLQEVQNIRKIIIIKDMYIYDLFPFNPIVCWNPDNLGPIAIPKKGETISLNRKNIDIYRDIIDVYEDNELLFDNNFIRINGKTVTQYTFKKDYFFVLNDNRLNYNDSRKFGFVPEDLILGKVLN